MKPADTHGKWTAREVAARLGVPEALVRSMVRAGLLQPGRGRSGELRFSFQDLVLLRAAHGLLTRDVRPERVRRALAKLLAERPDRPLSAVTLRAEGRQVVVADGRARWNVESGQTLLDFAAAAPAKVVETPARRRAAQARANSIEYEFERAYALEDMDPAAAADAYERLLERAPDHVDAHVNLGRLLQIAGHPRRAERHYARALQLRPDDATAAFNLGTVLEDQRRWEEAVQAYAQAVAIDPACADAHYNLACLYQRFGRKREALRHMEDARDRVPPSR